MPSPATSQRHFGGRRGLLLLLACLPVTACLAAEPTPLTVRGIRVHGAVFAPVRAVLRQVGLKQGWDAATDCVTLVGPEGTLSFVVGSTEATWQPRVGEPTKATLPVAPRYMGRVLCGPLEALAKLAGLRCEVVKDEPFRVELKLEDKHIMVDLPGADAAAEIEKATGSVILLETTKGDIYLELYDAKTPVTVGSFLELAGKGFYDGIKFHRVIADFMIQGGDPKGNGTGGPGFTIPDEANKGIKHVRGSLSMAKTAAPNSGGSQFFICHVACKHLDGVHTVFGETIKGLDVVDAIKQGDEIKRAVIVKEGPDAAKNIEAALKARVPER